MQDLVYRGVIVKASNYGDAHRMLWIFTETDGIVKAVRYGIRGKKTSNAAAFQVFSYGDFKLRPSRGDIMTAVSAEIKDGFYPIAEDIKKLSLAAYTADITYWLLGEANPDKRALSLFLNELYAIAYRDEELLKLKSVYEFKLMCVGGYMPSLSSCGVCGGRAEYFSCEKGCTVCREHHGAGDIKISDTVLALMRYVAGCEDKRMLSFSLKDAGVTAEFNAVAEKYLSIQCDKHFDSLDYFYAMQ